MGGEIWEFCDKLKRHHHKSTQKKLLYANCLHFQVGMLYFKTKKKKKISQRHEKSQHDAGWKLNLIRMRARREVYRPTWHFLLMDEFTVTQTA